MFCKGLDCPVVYFTAAGEVIHKSDVSVRVGVKEKCSPRPICYCFGHTVESIRDELGRGGRSTVIDSVRARFVDEVKIPRPAQLPHQLAQSLRTVRYLAVLMNLPPRSCIRNRHLDALLRLVQTDESCTLPHDRPSVWWLCATVGLTPTAA
jgi:hypothetical protein